MWTISDFPGYTMLSGWGTKTDKGCPCCGMETMCRRLEIARKYSYTYHRRFLNRRHRFRRDTTSFDGTMEWGTAPKRLSGIDVLRQLDQNGVLTEYKKEDLKKRVMGDYNVENHRHWKKRSIFFELPYWKHNMIRHNLDVMHIEKNVCDNVIFTLLNVKGKTKDNLNARHELAKIGVRKPLHAFKRPSGRWCLPPGPCNMGLSEKDTFCKIEKLRITSGDTLPEDIITLSKGLNDWGQRHKSCVVHGFRFRVKSLDIRKKTQNSGVFCSAYTSCYASSKDRRPQTGAIHYYGVLTDIIKIYYSSNLHYNLFKCDWVNNEKGLTVDQFKFTLVNFNHVMYTGREYSDEPYILSTQAEQVWYVDEPLESDWKLVVKMNRRDNFDIYSWERQVEIHTPLELDDRPVFGDVSSWLEKRKRSGRSVIDVICEMAGSSTMHDSPSSDRGRRVHLQSRFGSTSSLPLHDASHSSSSGISVNPSEDFHNIGHPAPYFPAKHHVSDLPSCSGDIFHANGNSNSSHCAPSVPIEHHNRADFPSCSVIISVSNVNTSAHLKKGRGRSKPIARWNKDEKLQLELTLDGEIDGPDRVEFKTQLGVMARNAYRFPLIYTSFDCMPQLLLDDLWSEVKENTTLPEEAKSYVLEDFNEKWKQGKYELKKKYFRPYQNDPEKLKELTVDLVPPEQFKYPVDYWKLVETQEEAERNTQNIAQHKFHHNLGRTPIFELKKKILLIEGKFPSRIDIFCESRPVTSETSNLIKQMRDSISRVPEAKRTAELEERVWIEFMGEDGHGRVKCAGRGIKPSKRRHTLSSNEVIKKKIQEVVQEVEEKMRGEKEQMRKKIDEMKEEREKMKGLMEQMEKKMSQTREEMTQEVVENVVSYFGLGHFPVALFIGQSATTFRPFEFRQEPDSSSASGTMSVGASASSKDLAWSATKPQGKPSTNWGKRAREMQWRRYRCRKLASVGEGQKKTVITGGGRRWSAGEKMGQDVKQPL
ncbi:hypothetical protein BUALT_Bualt02G0032500 [Buddleja alternifolia]|uniref:DUF4216 domain-containing protein n=1 Tax=Buddleja alternifolia TaxID=168488 RepID=A0AAV6Y522_9LAMI|nr:hypothetical protein BUALT_Bualt02G0032500 [Buddleja alternifolia]